MSAIETLTIERLGQRGEGIAAGAYGPVFTPYALPGDVVRAEVDGDRGALIEVATPSPDRVAPICKHYAQCGGCAVQALAPNTYQTWKRELVTSALSRAGLDVAVDALIDAHGEGRRRATFHARIDGGRVELGFMRARSHAIIEIDACPVLAPGMRNALAAARGVAETVKGAGKPLDILVTATDEGLDVDMRGTGALDDALSRKLIAVAAALDLARVSNHGQTIIERRAPVLSMGRAGLVPPPGAFLQATRAGEETLARLAAEGVGKVKRVADLFAGVGTFALRLAEGSEVHAVENDAPALAALERAWRAAQGLKRVTIEKRDLMRRPLLAAELERFDAIVFDPPRAGAEAQAREIAKSTVARVVAVSCNAQTFARDTRLLVDGGYVCERVTPVDQFRHSPHVEIVAIFSRARARQRRKGGLLG